MAPPENARPGPPPVPNTGSVMEQLMPPAGRPETCPKCRKQVVMIKERQLTGWTWCVACGIGWLLSFVVVGLIGCIWVLVCSDCCDLAFKCPNCGEIVRNVAIRP